MKNVLIIGNDFITIYNYRKELVNYILSKYNVIILIPKDERSQYFEDLGCIVENLIISRFGMNPFSEIKTIKCIKKAIEKYNPLVCLTFTIKPNIYVGIATRTNKVPFIANITGIGTKLYKKGIFSTALFFLLRYSLKNASFIFFQNKSNMDLFKTKKVSSKNNNYVLIPGSGINVQEYEYSKIMPKNITKFVTVARLRKDKGYDELFDAIKIVYECNKNVEFHIVGWSEDDSYLKKIEKLSKIYPIIYHGNKSKVEVKLIMKECDCLIHPSYHEGMSNVMLEASALGRPCIASNIPGCKEIVNDEISGFLFEVKNSIELSNKVLKFIQLDYIKKNEMGLNARKHVEVNFSINKVIEKYMDAIEKIEKGNYK